MGRNSCLVLSKAMAWEVIGPRKGPITVLLLNDMLSNCYLNIYLLPYMSAALSLAREAFLCSGQQLMQTQPAKVLKISGYQVLSPQPSGEHVYHTPHHQGSGNIMERGVERL